MPIEGFQHYQPRKWLSISSLVACARCPRRYFYSSGCRLIPAEGEHTALKFGEAIHAALPWILAGEKGVEQYIEKYKKENPDLDENSVKIVRAAARPASIAYSEFMRVWGSTLGDEKRNPENAKLMLLEYATSHRPGAGLFTLLQPPVGDIQVSDSVSPWEVPWAIDIGLDVPLVGRIDGMCKHRDTGEPFGLEFKTSSEMSARLVVGFEMNNQICGYTLALRLYTGEPVAGVMLDLIAVQKKGPSSMSYPIRVIQHQLEDFVQWARFWGQMILQCEKDQNFPRWYTGCTPYQSFGSPGFMCEYKNLCQTTDWTKFKDFYKVRADKPFDIGAVKSVKVPEGAVAV